MVKVAELRYRKSDPLTYYFESELEVGAVVIVPYGNKSVLGFVYKANVKKPEFEVKNIISSIEGVLLPKSVMQLEDWMHSYYPGGGSITQLFLPSGLQNTSKNEKPSKQKHDIERSEYPKLTQDQAQAFNQIKRAAESVLLHGETGSGKSRLYLEVIDDVLAKDRSALVLVPEISLVPQMQNYLEGFFGLKVMPIHSGLTKTIKIKNWLKTLNSSEPVVVVGARSAIFSPFKDLGVVIVDEMHEPAYKQDSGPFYYGLRAAAQLAKVHGAKIIYGSATPSIAEYFIAKKTNSLIIEMNQSALPTQQVKTSIIDMKDSKNLSSFSNFSIKLLESIRSQLDKNQQTLIFLNRRGTARQVLCKSCGWQAQCPNCDTSLVYHADKHIVRCHTCGYKSSPPYACPSCGEKEVTYRSLGTKALSEALNNIFPEATIQRFDTDNLASEKLDRHFDSIKSGKIDILVGTQMLGKGLDLPKLGLVGIVNADTGLGMPDFSASERTYQLLHQAIGRVGRGHVDGEVIIQTYNPKNPVISAAINRDWNFVYNQEIAEREKFVFPPFCFLLKILVSRKSSESAEKFARKLYTQIAELKLPIQANPPAPSFYQRSFGKYNWQIVAKSKDRKTLIELLNRMPAGDWNYDIDPINLL